MDFLFGEAKKDTIEIAQKAHFLRKPARDQMKEGRKMFHELAKEEHFRKQFISDLKGHLSKELVKDEEHALKHIGNIVEAMDNSIKDDIMIAHLMIQALMEFIHKDKQISDQGFSHPAAIHLISECEEQLAATRKLLFDYSNALRQQSTER